MENEVMNYEELEDEVYEMEPEAAGMGNGVAMLIGAGLTLAVGAMVKLGTKAYAAYKDRKALRKPEEGETVEVTDEDIAKVTK